MTRYRSANCPKCGAPVATRVGHPPPKCPDCAIDEKIGVDPPVRGTHHTTPQAAQWGADRMEALEALEEALDRMVTEFGPIDWCDTEDAREAVEMAIAALAKAREVKP